MNYLQICVLLLLLIFIFTMSGCSRNQANAQNLSSIPYYPEWWKTQSSYLHINSYGLGSELSIIASKDAAKADALLQMAKYVEDYVNDMMAKFVKEAVITNITELDKTRQVAQTAANTRFSNSLISHTETIIEKTSGGEAFKTYLQLMIPKFEINRNLLEQIHNDPALYDTIRSSASFQNWEKLLMNY